jgi:Flp pilus assembly pilin Flp
MKNVCPEEESSHGTDHWLIQKRPVYASRRRNGESGLGKTPVASTLLNYGLHRCNFVSRFWGRNSMGSAIRRLIRDEQGQDLIEYGLLIGIITAGAITFITPIGQKVAGYFSTLNSGLP